MMDERYQDVSKAAEETFKWIIENSEMQTSSNPKLHLSFKEWLESGDGVFHISGKPGSGKSTLMKFLCQHTATTEALQRWAGQKRLVVARFFFWKPGEPLQKSLVGLIRSLLFSILERFPETIRLVLPQYWDPIDYEPWTSPLDINIGNDEILTAFDELIKSVLIYEDHCFCFFIDGLDEFEDKFQSHGNLVRCSQEWVKASAGRVKICVSSRELPAFQNRFRIDQRIRLHELTRDDMEKVVHQRIGSEEYFRELKKKNADDCEQFLCQIVDKAEGVFLWLTLTIKLLCEGFDCRYSLSDLLRKLDSIPQEMEDFFGYITHSISKEDRKKAYCTLAFALEASKLEETIKKTYGHIIRSTPSICLSLFRYSFLGDFVDNREFAKMQALKNMDAKEIEDQLAVAAAQLAGRCKGLLEPRPNEDITALGDGYQLVWGSNVKFTHRSIPEFLEDHLQNNAADYLKDFDFVDALIQTSLACFKSLDFRVYEDFQARDLEDSQASDSEDSQASDFENDLAADPMDAHAIDLEALIFTVRESQMHDKTPYFESLDALDEILCLRQLAMKPIFDKSKWSNFVSTTFSTSDRYKLFISLLHFAGLVGFHEYIVWKAQRFPEELHGANGAELLKAVVDCCIECIVTPEQCSRCLRELFLRGINPNCSRLTNNCLFIWESLVIGIGIHNVFPKILKWKAIEVFLEFGADPPFWFRVSSQKERSNGTKEDGETEEDGEIEEEGETEAVSETNEGDGTKKDIIIITFGQRSHEPRAGGTGDYFEAQWDSNSTPKQLHVEGGRATLREWVDFYSPENAEAIRKLLDRNPTLYDSLKPKVEPSSDVNPNAETLSDTRMVPYSYREPKSMPKTEVSVTFVCKQILDFHFWTWLKGVLKTPIVPWLLLGVISVLIFSRQT